MSPQPPSRDPFDPVLPPTSPPMSPLAYRTPVEPLGELPVLSNRAMAWGAVVLIVLGVGLAAGLLVVFGNGQHSGRLDAIRTAGTIVLGTGGAAALWLTAVIRRASASTTVAACAAGPAGRPVRAGAARSGQPGPAADHRRPAVRLPADALRTAAARAGAAGRGAAVRGLPPAAGPRGPAAGVGAAGAARAARRHPDVAWAPATLA